MKARLLLSRRCWAEWRIYATGTGTFGICHVHTWGWLYTLQTSRESIADFIPGCRAKLSIEEILHLHQKPLRQGHIATRCSTPPHSPTPRMTCLHRYVRKRFDCYRTNDERCSRNDQGRILQQNVRYERPFAYPISGCSHYSTDPPGCVPCHCCPLFHQTWQYVRDVHVGSNSLIWHQSLTNGISYRRLSAWEPTPHTHPPAIASRFLTSQVDAAVSKVCSVS